MDAVTSADMAPSIASRSAASAPNPGSMARGASVNPAQNRTGSASARSQDSQAVAPGGRAAAQLDSSTLLPAPAEPTTTVSRWAAPAASRSCSADRVISVPGSVVGRNLPSANRTPREAPSTADTSSATTALLRVSPLRRLCRSLPSRYSTRCAARKEGAKVTFDAETVRGSWVTLERVMTQARSPGTLKTVNRT